MPNTKTRNSRVGDESAATPLDSKDGGSDGTHQAENCCSQEVIKSHYFRSRGAMEQEAIKRLGDAKAVFPLFLFVIHSRVDFYC
ncbi:MAG: hypothetical protein ACXVI3_04890 [Halobacteriota archaeon]